MVSLLSVYGKPSPMKLAGRSIAFLIQWNIWFLRVKTGLVLNRKKSLNKRSTTHELKNLFQTSGTKNPIPIVLQWQF